MAQMVRKQIYISAEQDAFLKQRSSELGITEAEVVRQALEAVKQASQKRTPEEAWQDILAYIREHRMGDPSSEPSSKPWKFNREEIYDEMFEERFARYSGSLNTGKSQTDESTTR